MEGLEILKILATALGGVLGTGGITAFYYYRTNRPKTDAEARQIRANVENTFADGWERYASKLEARQDYLEKKLDDQEATCNKILATKDEEIRSLKRRVFDLETKVAKYEDKAGKVDEVKVVIHEAVEENVNKLKP